MTALLSPKGVKYYANEVCVGACELPRALAGRVRAVGNSVHHGVPFGVFADLRLYKNAAGQERRLVDRAAMLNYPAWEHYIERRASWADFIANSGGVAALLSLMSSGLKAGVLSALDTLPTLAVHGEPSGWEGW